jgi:tetratricopeptide (TPR) repeat protein
MRVYLKLFALILCVIIGNSSIANESQFVTTISPERHKEFLIERDLGKALLSWLADGNEPAEFECVKLVDSLMAVREPTVRSIFIQSQVANLRQKPKDAIAALEKAIEKYPNERAAVSSFPIRIVGRFWIGTIARHSGDFAKAQQTYKSILNEPNALDGNEILTMICNLYLAEIDSEHLKNNKEALIHLNEIGNIPRPKKEILSQYDFYRDWAQYKIDEISKGKAEAVKNLKAYQGSVSSPYVTATHLYLSGLVLEPLSGCFDTDKKANKIGETFYNRIFQSGKSSIDEEIIKFTLGYSFEHSGRYAEAEIYLSELFNKETFLSPSAEFFLAIVKKDQKNLDEANKIMDQVLKKYPGYESAVTLVRNSWK